MDAAGSFPCSVTYATRLGLSVGDMETAYNDAAGRINPDYLYAGAGSIDEMTLTTGLYKWSTSLINPGDVLISGGPDDSFKFQVAWNIQNELSC